jgi:DNA-binding MltR family transcriptional regulator
MKYVKGDVSNEPELRKLNDFLTEFNKESPRGLVLISAAYLDEILEGLLIAFLIDGKISTKFISDPTSPLGSFYSRTILCYCLGLLEEDEYRALNIIRDIRNTFAHKWGNASFDEQRIKDLVRLLPTTGHKDLDLDSLAHYKMSVASLLVQLLWRERLVKKEKREIRDWPNKR